MYAVVYGNSWDDVDYFTSYNKACIKLIIQSIEMKDFPPFLMEYIAGDHGTMERTKNMMAILDQEALKKYDKTEVKQNPYSVFHLIKSIF